MRYTSLYASLMLLLGGILPPTHMHAQDPDFALDRLYEIPSFRHRGPVSEAGSEVSAGVRFYCDGAYLLLYIHVRDENIYSESRPMYSDHVELSLALPDNAYPADFEYTLHPRYVQSRSEDGTIAPRFFSLYGEYASRLELGDFLDSYDYPRQSPAMVPASEDLHIGDADFGVMKVALFPDGRDAIQLNQLELEPVENALSASLTESVGHITYEVSRQDPNGYELHVRISPEALGFVTLPELGQVRFLLQVFDAPSPEQKAEPILSTTATSQDAPPSYRPVPATFTQVHLQRPLYTNFTIIPDYIFNLTDYHPVCVYGDSSWTSIGIDVDALVYDEQHVSQSLTEVALLAQPFTYSFDPGENAPVEILRIDHNYINKLPTQLIYILIEDQLLKTERVRSLSPEPSQVSNEFFRFPDGATGAILRSNTSVDPYGWGACGTCIEESFQIWRVTKQDKQVLVDIQQGDGPNAYCQIQNLVFPNFYLLETSWIRPGEVLVLRLNHRYRTDKKRVKVSWQPDGSGVVVEEVR